MTHAEKCPVCGGTGKIMNNENPMTTGSPYEVKCHGCKGKGWVEVGDNDTIPPSETLFVTNEFM